MASSHRDDLSGYAANRSRMVGLGDQKGTNILGDLDMSMRTRSQIGT